MENIKNVLFEKNVFIKLIDELKNYESVFILTSKTPRKQYLQMMANILNENKIKFWTYCLSKTECCSDNILKVCSAVNGANVIISLGAGTTCDISKIVGKKLNLPVIVVPTTITHYGIFNNVAILNDGLPKYLETNFPSKVYLDESIIKKSPAFFINSSLCFSISMLESYFSIFAKHTLFNDDEINFNLLLSKIKKIEELTGWLSLSKEFAILNLMDYIFDLSQILKSDYKSSSTLLASKLNSSTLKNNFGEKCLLCSKILFACYLNYFDQKIITPKNIPNFEKTRDIIIKTPILQSFNSFNNFEEQFNIFINKTNFLLNEKIKYDMQKNKTKLFECAFNCSSLISKFANKLKAINCENNKIRMIDENQLYSSLQILPLLENQFLPNLLSRYGYLNIC